MALVVEDGSVVDNANTYVDVDDVDAYCALMNYTTWTDAEDTATETAKKESAIYRSMQFFESLSYLGSKTAYDNPLSFPREYIELETGDYFPDDEIPLALKNAVCEGAYLEYVTPGATFVTGGDVKRVKRKKIDALETEYFSSRSSVPYPKLKTMVRDFIASSSEVIRG